MNGVKEMLEVIAGLKELGIVAKLVLKDGRLGIDDIQHLGKILEKQEVLLAAFQGLGDIPSEVKDLSLDEAMVVIAAFVEAAKVVKDA